MLNKVILMGRLTKDPELRSTPGGVPVTSFTLAVERDFAAKGEERKADFIDIVCWRHTAEFTSKWFHKGQLVAVSGRLQQRKWQDKNGENRYSFEVVADEAHFAEKRSDSAPPAGQAFSGNSGMEPPAVSGGASAYAELSDDDDELPF